jgi:hypothetical protein
MPPSGLAEGGELMIHYMTLNQFWVGFLEARYADRFEALNSAKAEIDFDASWATFKTTYFWDYDFTKMVIVKGIKNATK